MSTKTLVPSPRRGYLNLKWKAISSWNHFCHIVEPEVSLFASRRAVKSQLDAVFPKVKEGIAALQNHLTLDAFFRGDDLPDEFLQLPIYISERLFAHRQGADLTEQRVDSWANLWSIAQVGDQQHALEQDMTNSNMTIQEFLSGTKPLPVKFLLMEIPTRLAVALLSRRRPPSDS